VVSTEYQEQTSATKIMGMTTRAATLPTTLPVTRELSRSISAHWAMKQSSATVATDRPTAALDRMEFTSATRGTSKTGRTDRYAQPKT
jgi:hypothetical protein